MSPSVAYRATNGLGNLGTSDWLRLLTTHCAQIAATSRALVEAVAAGANGRSRLGRLSGPFAMAEGLRLAEVVLSGAHARRPVPQPMS